MKHVTIYRESDAYSSFPHVVILPNGKLAVAFRRAGKFSSDAAKNNVATHHDPDSAIYMITSDDMGQTWPEENRRLVYKGRWGVNDPAMTVLADGSVICRFVALDIRPTSAVGGEPPRKIFSHRAEHGLVTSVVGNMIMRSTDNGETWTEIGVENVPEIGGSCSRDPIVEMADGSWLAPVYTGAPQRSDISWVVRSFDRGRTWCEPIRIASDENGRFSELQGINYNETSLISLGGGEMLAMIRADETYHTSGDQFMPVGMVGNLVTARSLNGGLCWTFPQQTGIWGQPGSLMVLSNGDLLATYGYRRAPYGIRCAISKDRGQTWLVDEEIIIRDDSPTWDCGYPFSIELEPGKMFTVYYFVDDTGTRHVCGTHWNLP